jgi:hypothetical protein
MADAQMTAITVDMGGAELPATPENSAAPTMKIARRFQFGGMFRLLGEAASTGADLRFLRRRAVNERSGLAGSANAGLRSAGACPSIATSINSARDPAICAVWRWRLDIRLRGCT